ncbi:MAG: ABC transporter ATP-binding protein [Deltaproteobacteria bacterium]|nr:ABC transporter ATP-binding protein [Deltaproteobacteria bacterium]
MSLLKVHRATMQFGGLKALSDFSLDVAQGDLQGLIGPNGAGKTTAFNVMTGVYRPTSGAVVVDGERMNGRLPHQVNRAGLARTFQNIRLFKELTALDNVKVACLADDRPPSSPFSRARIDGLRRQGRFAPAHALDAWGNYLDWWRALFLTSGYRADEAHIEERALRLLDVMGLAHRAGEQARNLPYGEQRRLEIARALATSPKVLLLDEPAAGMNTKEKAELMVQIRRLRDEFALGVLLIEHDMKLVMGICEQITVLDHGETIAVGTPDQVKKDPKVIEAYLGVESKELQA